MTRASEVARGSVDRLALLLVSDAATPSATRRRHGTLAAVLALLSFGYGLLVLPFLPPGDRGLQVVLLAAWPLGAAVCCVAPWDRLGRRATLLPALGATVLLTVGYAGVAGALQHYVPLVAALFAYVVVTQPAGWSARTGALLTAGAAVAMLVGRQQQATVEILGALTALTLLGGLTEAALAHTRTRHQDMHRLYGALTQLLAAPSTDAAAEVVTDLAGLLLDADGAVLLLSDGPGGTVFRGAAGAGPGLGDDPGLAEVDLATQSPEVAQCVHSGRPLLLPGGLAAPVASIALAERLRMRSGIYLPVPGEGGTLGLLLAWWNRPVRPADQVQDDALELLSRHAGQALERLRGMSRALEEARTDSLTGIGNRRAFLDAVHDLGDDDVVILLDLDHFKRVNDTHGHAAGDTVLVQFARALEYSVRGDIVVRLGGDEFAIVLQGSGPDGVDAVLARLAAEWHEPYGVTYSHGVAQRDGAETMPDTLARADAGVYAGKAALAATLATARQVADLAELAEMAQLAERRRLAKSPAKLRAPAS